MGELKEQTQADAKNKEVNAELERMQRKHLLLQTEFEAQRVSLENSRHFTWIWLIASAGLMSILLVILHNWIGS